MYRVPKPVLPAADDGVTRILVSEDVANPVPDDPEALPTPEAAREVVESLPKCIAEDYRCWGVFFLDDFSQAQGIR